MAADREKILQAAQRFVDKKKYDRAIAEYQKIVQQDPNDARTLLKIGDLQARMQAFAEAIATYDRVGQYYSSQGFALKAIAVYKQIRELIQKHAPKLADRYGHIVPKLAEIYTQLGLTSDALAAYDEVATRLQRAGRDRDAIDVFRRMVELDATNPLPHLRLAEACCRVQSLDEAIDSFWAAAELLMKLNRRDDALKVLERILHFRVEPKYAKLAARLYLQSSRQQDGLQALAKLQLCFQADPKDLETLSLLGQAFTAIGQQAKAIEVYKEMARLARELEEHALFQQVIDHLLSVVPDDEQVRALANLGQPSRPPPVEEAAVSVEAEYVEDSVHAVEDLRPVPILHRESEFDTEATTAARAPMPSGPDLIVIDEGTEGDVAIYDGADSFDAGAHARKAIVDAESFRKLRLFSKAIETLRIALEVDPRAISIRGKLREIYAEAGDLDAAIGEDISIAAIYIDLGHNEHAEAVLYSVLEAEPEHPTALQMLQDIGALAGGAPQDYADDGVSTGAADPRQQRAALEEYGVDSGAGAGPDEGFVSETSVDYAMPAGGEGYPGEPAARVASDFDPNEPLPSYDLEEVSAAHAMGSGEHAAVATEGPQPGAFDSVDDPFGEPLPSYPLGPEQDLAAGRHGSMGAGVPAADERSLEERLPSFGDEDLEEASLTDLDAVEEGPSAPIASAASANEVSAIEEVLEEAEFFAARGLHEDAKMILEDQLSRTPGHRLLIERLQEVEEALGTDRKSGAREVRGTPLSEAPEGDRAFDIAASLDALDEFDDVTDKTEVGRPAFASQVEEVDVDQVFAKFKAGVEKQVAEGDSSTHYDLGVAYKEMGLLPDAVHEFELAAKDSTRECMCYAMVGMIRLEQNELDKAADAFIRGLHATEKTVEQEMSLYYDLGTVYEMQGSNDEALYYFQKIARRDPGYRDVRDRIAALQPSKKTQEKSTARPIADDDEFDRVFDELFDTKSS